MIFIKNKDRFKRIDNSIIHMQDSMKTVISLTEAFQYFRSILQSLELDDACLKTLRSHYEDCATNLDVMKCVLRSPKIDVQKVYVKLLLFNQDDHAIFGAG